MSQKVNKWSSRKYITLIGCIGLFSVQLAFKHLDSQSYSALMLVVLSAYFAANVWEKKE